MRTDFAHGRLADPQLRDADAILRACVHCGFCLATCPTYLLLGDELDSPRGRIYLAKTMLESGKPATAPAVKHLDRCLTCLSCMTTCPSGVHYAHLIQQAREHIERTYVRPWPERLLRRGLATIIPNPMLFRLAALAGRLVRPVARPFTRLLRPRVRAMLTNTPRRIAGPSWVDRPQVIPAEGERRLRVVLLAGCAQQVLRPEINEATVRVLTRHGCEVVIARGAGCCGAILHQLEFAERAKALAVANIRAWRRELEMGDLDAIVFNASGCGVAIRDYGHLLREDPEWAAPAARIAALGRDVTEVLLELGLRSSVAKRDEVGDLSRSVHDAARARPAHAVERTADAGRLRRLGACGSAYLLRLCRHLLGTAAGTVRGATRTQACRHRRDGTFGRRHRQHRVHHPTVRRQRCTSHAHSRTARLGNRWSAAPRHRVNGPYEGSPGSSGRLPPPLRRQFRRAPMISSRV